MSVRALPSISPSILSTPPLLIRAPVHRLHQSVSEERSPRKPLRPRSTRGGQTLRLPAPHVHIQSKTKTRTEMHDTQDKASTGLVQ